MAGCQRSSYTRNAMGVLVREGESNISHQAAPVVAINHEEARQMMHTLERPNPEGAGPMKSVTRPTYETDEDLKRRYAQYTPKEGFQFSDAPDQFAHYGAGLKYNAAQGPLASGTMARMNRGAVQESAALFTSFLQESSQHSAQEKASPPGSLCRQAPLLASSSCPYLQAVPSWASTAAIPQSEAPQVVSPRSAAA
jgi:hypothetical protein